MILLLSIVSQAEGQRSFKDAQLSFPRVKSAYQEKWDNLKRDLQTAKFKTPFQIYITAYKAEGKLEVWIKNNGDQQYRLFREYPFCKNSGTLGPKAKENDGQTPEGFYYINVFNPQSTYHLSLGINYPNEVDLVRSGKNKPGNEIYIHGKCITIGCIPLTDEKIKEVYVLGVEARSTGQSKIPVHIFPFKMTVENMKKYEVQFPQQMEFWKTLQPAYLQFEKNKRMPQITSKEGKYMISKI